MKKAAGHLTVILKGILLTGFGIQIILGLIWMCFNFPHLQEFSQPSGILYRGLTGLAGERYGILYALQLGLGFWAGYRLLGSLGAAGRARRLGGSLALLTFPMAMQCHLAVSPYSLVSSLLLLELSGTLTAVRKEERAVRELALAGVCWLLLALLLPEYFILGAAPIVLALLFGLPALRKRPVGLWRGLLLFAAFGGVIVGIQTLAGEEDYLPDRESVAFSLCSRMTWPTAFPDFPDWPEEVQEVVGDTTAWEVSRYPDNMQTILRPIMKENFDDAQAAEYYLEMAAFSLKRHTPMVIRQTGGDFVSYLVTPLILPMQLRGETYASYSGRNYEYMFLHTPVLTKYYVNYGCWWFAVMLGITAVLTLIRGLADFPGLSRKGAACVLLCLLWAVLTAALYTMRGAGIMDYKCTVAVNLLWLVWAVLTLGKRDAAESGEGGSGEEAEGKTV